MNAEAKMKKALVELILREVFFAALALKLTVKADPTCACAWTDGVTLGYNPAFVESLGLEEAITLYAHEAFHCAHGHIWRRGGRDPEIWNEATDYVVNGNLSKAGYVLPLGALVNPFYDGLSPEAVYDHLVALRRAAQAAGAQNLTSDSGSEGAGSPPPPSKQEPGKQGPPAKSNEAGAGGQEAGKQDPSGKPDRAGAAGQQPRKQDPPRKPSPGQWGEVRDAVTEEVKGDWEMAVVQAAALAEGKLPCGAERLVEEVRHPQPDCRGLLRRYVAEACSTDYSWERPDPRFIYWNLYLPSVGGQQLGTLAVAVDSSGSISETLASEFLALLQTIVEDTRPARTIVYVSDAAIHFQAEFNPGEPIKVKFVGGGGTDFRPVFARLEKEPVQPAVLVYLTDGKGSYPPKVPEYPVVWIGPIRRKVPFGEVIVYDGKS